MLNDIATAGSDPLGAGAGAGVAAGDAAGVAAGLVLAEVLGAADSTQQPSETHSLQQAVQGANLHNIWHGRQKFQRLMRARPHDVCLLSALYLWTETTLKQVMGLGRCLGPGRVQWWGLEPEPWLEPEPSLGLVPELKPGLAR